MHAGALPEQALYQLAGLGATLVIAIAGGLLAATLVKYSDCTGQVMTAVHLITISFVKHGMQQAELIWPATVRRQGFGLAQASKRLESLLLRPGACMETGAGR